MKRTLCDFCERDITDEAKFTFRTVLTAGCAPGILHPDNVRTRQVYKATACIGCVAPEDLDKLPPYCLTEAFLTGTVKP